ncbi:hypothetical protein VB711_22695 [Cronbergia sp. UHCC 0137]|uniref:hypothetical protein n=1 Tax=Cronbergia sp. UHCC 0137 TaxID=3110239 RepID=UPI002B213670|nr:hypothetical protein [Cronbergia sp. UHCC 0137]MEA5620627.1 hypothetical protein [Cronbergia sp. UHCC 0137]
MRLITAILGRSAYAIAFWGCGRAIAIGDMRERSLFWNVGVRSLFWNVGVRSPLGMWESDRCLEMWEDAIAIGDMRERSLFWNVGVRSL